MISKKKPAIFQPKFDVVSCFIENNGRFLLLKRSLDKPQGGTWGMPAGKVSEGESLKQATIREIKEEIGLVIGENDLAKPVKMYVKYPEYDYVYYVYSLSVENELKINLNPVEHTEHKWVSAEEALTMELIQDEDTCIKLFYNL
jgi:8-oxo-dGTP diphosphatase